MVYKYKFYMWLIDTLSKQPLTLPEIQRKWELSSANEEGSLLAERTFQRYRREVESLMDVQIVCNKSDGNRYQLVNYDADSVSHNWMLSAFRISQLSSQVNNKNKIVLETAPPAAHLLQELLDAINTKKILYITYKSHYKEHIDAFELFPIFVKLFKQRWYVVGWDKESDKPRTLALERIKTMEINENEKFKLTPRIKKLVQPDTFFEDCFGVVRMEEPQIIKFRAFWPQNLYLKDTPIHTSQTVITDTEDYTDFEIFVRPSYDLKQEFLWNRDKLAILSPQKLKEDMIEIIQAMLESYKTGTCQAVE